MSISICVEKSKPSKVKRLGFLPRIGLFVDFGGRQFSYLQAPITETLLNLKTKGFSLKNLTKVALMQFKEIKLHDVKIK